MKILPWQLPSQLSWQLTMTMLGDFDHNQRWPTLKNFYGQRGPTLANVDEHWYDDYIGHHSLKFYDESGWAWIAILSILIQLLSDSVKHWKKRHAWKKAIHLHLPCSTHSQKGFVAETKPICQKYNVFQLVFLSFPLVYVLSFAVSSPPPPARADSFHSPTHLLTTG